MDGETEIKFFLGDKEHTVSPQDVTPETSLNTYIREKNHLTATKRSCLEGGCGVCVVVVETIDPLTKKAKFLAVNSCLVSIFTCHGWKILSPEGIGNHVIGYHPLQKKLAEGNGSQCGFCSSGMVMNMYAMVKSGKVTEEEVENNFSGNLCRCTGYRPILQTFRDYVKDIEDYNPCSRKCDKTCEILKPTILKSEDKKWIKFYFLRDLLLQLRSISVTYMLIAGNTSQGVHRHPPPQMYLDVTNVKELVTWSVTNTSLTLGGNLTLNLTIEIFKSISKDHSKFTYVSKMANHIDLVANVPVRNIATLAGNLMLKHQNQDFQSDIFLILETVDATLVIVDADENEITKSPAEFLKLNMNKKVIKSIILKGYDDSYIYTSYKIMSRAQNTAANVNAGFLFKMNKTKIDRCAIVYGGINPKFVHATKTENYLKHKDLFNNETLQKAYTLLNEEVDPDYVLPEPTPEYRRGLAIALFYKFVLSIAPLDKLSPEHLSGGKLFERPLSSGKAEYTTKENRYPLSKPMVKLEAFAQATGQAEYIEDMPDRPGQVYCAFVLANAPANSLIKNVDTSKALEVPGVVKYLSKEDVPGNNNWAPKESGIFMVDEFLFCEGTVQYYDQPLGLIVANTQEVAEKAAELVLVTYEKSSIKPLLTVRDVLKASDYEKNRRITKKLNKDRKSKGTDVKHVVKGEYFLGPQYHFHMEVQCCSVVPLEDGLDVFAATQWMDCNQIAIAALLGLKNNQINVKVRRLGGGFGGKITRSIFVSAAAALAAYVLRRPAKMRLKLEHNMRVIGKRWPLLVQYEAGLSDKGIIQYIDAKLYSDYGVGGNENMDTMLFSQFQNGYNVDTWQLEFSRVWTDTHANAFARAPGTQNGIMAIESIMEHLATTIEMDPYEFKLANINREEHKRIFDFNDDLMKWGDIEKRKQDIKDFNKKNRWRKKGMSIIPMAWILEVHAGFLSLVSVYHGDGSVAIAHGGVEMGQGINTKVAQCAAYKLGIPLDMIQIKPCTTMSTPSCSATGGSITTEAVCYATLQACETILQKMEPIKQKMKNPTWNSVVSECFKKYILLNGTELFNPTQPNIAQYFIYALCAAEVEVDILTGKYQILQVDLIEDVGDTMNPTIDVGQVEGAFTMGTGYFTTEEIIMSPEGKILTDRTWNYKPPGAKDIPIRFNIKFPGNIPNSVGVLGSKATAEPPTCLSATVPLAIRNAVGFARKESNPSNPIWYPINGCSTIENTFLNSLNDFRQYKL